MGCTTESMDRGYDYDTVTLVILTILLLILPILIMLLYAAYENYQIVSAH